MCSITYWNNSHIHIKQTPFCYVSPYSLFFLHSYPSIMQKNSSICDYGAGTGILGIAALDYSPSKVVFIEKTNSFLDILHENIHENISNNALIDYYVLDNAYTLDTFDTILCNPASLPDICNPDEFCKGGKLGLDMIYEVIAFSNEHLQPKGSLYLIVTSILPHSLIYSFLNKFDFCVKIISKKKIAFRPHYSGIREWVDTNKKTYPEMMYYEHNGTIYEELNLWKIERN